MHNQDYTLYMAKKYALRQGKEEYTQSFSKLHLYEYGVRAKDLVSSVNVSILKYNSNINSTAHFHRCF